MLKRWAFPVLLAAIIGSSSAWTAQFELRPAQLKKMALTSTQAKAIAAVQTVAVLSAVPNKLVIRAPRNLCAEVEAINDWDFRKQIEDHLSRALSSRFMVVPVSYDGDALNSPTALGEIPRSALPTGDGVDAFIVIWGSVQFWHTPGMLSDPFRVDGGGDPNPLFVSPHEPEYEFTKFTVDIINTKTKKTIVRKEIQPYPTFGQDGGFANRHWNVRGAGAKERAEDSWLCSGPLTEERRQEMKNDYQMLIQAVLDFALPMLRLT